MEVIVEYGYESQNADELSIKKGDRIRNVTRKEDGWYEGELVHTGQRGVFPDNFVKPAKSSAKSQPPSEERNKPAPAAPPSPAFQARVLYSYVPVNDDELSIQQNQVVTVLRLVEDGWYEGTLEGRRGVFPSNYVQKMDEDAKRKKVFGIGFGNIFSGKQIELKTKETLVTADKRPRAKVLYDYEPIQPDELRLVRDQ
ncbi:CD2-associated, partial [Brachionus plicatilis]